MMAAEALSRRQPQKATRAETEAQETRRALQWAKDKLRQEGKPEREIKFSDLIWQALQDAAMQLSRLPDRERVWLLSSERSAWPEIARPSEDNRQVEAQIQNEVAILGVRSPDEWRPLFIIEKPDTERMLAVLAWLRHVRGRTAKARKRDQMIALALAQGQSVKQVRRLMPKYPGEREPTDRAVYMVRSKVLANIADAIWRHWH